MRLAIGLIESIGLISAIQSPQGIKGSQGLFWRKVRPHRDSGAAQSRAAQEANRQTGAQSTGATFDSSPSSSFTSTTSFNRRNALQILR